MTGSAKGQKDHASRLAAAARWYAELQAPDAEAATWDGFRAWERDPKNAAAFRQVEAALNVLDRTPLGAPASEVHKARRPVGLLIGALTAASVLVASGAGIFFNARPPEPLVYVTAIGEQRRVDLEDGSLVTLNTASRIEVAYSGDERLIRLTGGQALFEVETAATAFVVEAAGSRTRALGTTFEVFLMPQGPQVTLLEGSVGVLPSDYARETRLEPGERLIVENGVAGPAQQVDTAAALSWRSGVLQFTDETLADAVSELNRYSEVRIELADAGLASERLSGSFRAGDQELFVSALTLFLPVESQRIGDRIVITRSEDRKP